MIKVDSIKPIIKNKSKKISLLNANAKASEMVIIANFKTQSQQIQCLECRNKTFIGNLFFNKQY
ncbi:unnamed protein product [Paramecium primaurelia]|uniref:Uncharacterized protein n=1 Tax=Paramecium primaurelia TaxID=5886 RepID=A0A8S1QR68_PARPR|nr:unnamed protein product [Paramecium primaurelia]